ncbi:hypothetical protein [Alicyclobacillus acidoterrestris]|uniref:Uncharacterized protein n=1 Tax=Alicyclobacillus acidoterrestris (strain ATCC 49025 / DSM 3922 / CIP 106132 / NCIMB 13137 / GD3B) TaxID=1356854 RepID=T0BU80_ALIAG|nr:hypothetical protein [Alicyclobacillus acidoterrestris]EPZ47638.1 hypothetical protein N007_05110 [Alicyclobacillus acidoterrestris ATCC 49025]UNO48042.1 hypothetical protein K1I37_15320 [Alicyclobacillus acidoterrestris]
MLFAPYIGPKEFADTFVEVDLNCLSGNGNTDPSAALLSILRRASSLADRWCKQILRSTIDTEIRMFHPAMDGTITVWPFYTPIRQVLNLQYQFDGQTEWHDIDITTNLHVLDAMFKYSGRHFNNGLNMFVQYTYVNGFPVSTLANDVVAGADTLTLLDTSGIRQGDKLSIYDGENSEIVTVLSVSGNTITTLPLLYQHAKYTHISGMPNDISQATGMIAANLISRGSDGKTVVGDKEFKEQWASDSVITSDIQVLLQPYRVNL